MILSELWYNRYMKRNYRRTKTTVSMINYHFVFCPRYRRRLFLVAQICEQNGIVILAMECHIDHCHLFVNAPPTLSAAEIMKIIKGTTGRILKQEFFPDTVMQMWTRSYFVSTAGDVSNATIQRYVEEQKTRGG